MDFAKTGQGLKKGEEFFSLGLKKGQGLINRAAKPHQKFLGIPPPLRTKITLCEHVFTLHYSPRPLPLPPPPHTYTHLPSLPPTQNDAHASITLSITRELEPPPPSLPTYHPRPAHDPSFHETFHFIVNIRTC